MALEMQEPLVELRARQVVAGGLAAAFAPPDAGSCDPWRAAPAAHLHAAWRLVAEPHRGLTPGDLGFGEILPRTIDLEPLIRWLRLDPARRSSALERLFGPVISRSCPPCETEYLRSRDAFHRAQQLADIAGFYRAFGVEPSRQRPQRADHIALELEFVALLLEKLASSDEDAQAREEHARIVRDAHRAFLADHLTTWVPQFAQRLVEHGLAVAAALDDEVGQAQVRLLVGVARLLCGWIVTERRCAGLPPLRRVPVLEAAPALEVEGACAACEASPADSA
jgi:hypothetical protein